MKKALTLLALGTTLLTAHAQSLAVRTSANGTLTEPTSLWSANAAAISSALGINDASAGRVRYAISLLDVANDEPAISAGEQEIIVHGAARQQSLREELGIQHGGEGYVRKASILWDGANDEPALTAGDLELYINGEDRKAYFRADLGIQVSQTANGTTTWTSNATRDAFRGSLNLSPVAISGNYSDLVNKPVTGVSSVAGKTGNVTLDITDVPGLATTLAGKEPSLSTGSMTQYYRGDKTWVNFPQVFQGSGITVSGGPLSSGSVTVGLNATIANLNNSTSSQLAGVLTDETGTGSVVFSNNATLTTPNIGAATSTSLTSGDISASGNFTVTGQTVTRGISISSATTTFGFAMNRNVNTGAILNNSVGAAQFTFNGALGLFGLENYSSAGGINGSFIVGSNYLGFNTSYAGAADVSLGRNAAGIMQIGNGTNNASGSLLLNTLNASGNITLTSTTATLTNNGSTVLNGNGIYGDALGDTHNFSAGSLAINSAGEVTAAYTTANTSTSLLTRANGDARYINPLQTLLAVSARPINIGAGSAENVGLNAPTYANTGIRFEGTASASGDYSGTVNTAYVSGVGSGSLVDFNSRFAVEFWYSQGTNSANVTFNVHLGTNDRQNLTDRGIGLKINCGTGQVTAQVHNGTTLTNSATLGSNIGNLFAYRYLLTWDGVQTLSVYAGRADTAAALTLLGTVSAGSPVSGEVSRAQIRFGYYASGPSGSAQDALISAVNFYQY